LLIKKRKEEKMVDKNILIYQQKIDSTIESIAEEIKYITSTVVKKPFVIWRIKNSETLRKKMKLKKVKNIFLIDDVYAMRILVDSIDEIYAVLEHITKKFNGFIDHDYIEKPKRKLYEKIQKENRLRLVQFIAYKNGVPFEIQITTILFNRINESFHQKYHDLKYL